MKCRTCGKEVKKDVVCMPCYIKKEQCCQSVTKEEYEQSRKEMPKVRRKV